MKYFLESAALALIVQAVAVLYLGLGDPIAGSLIRSHGPSTPSSSSSRFLQDCANPYTSKQVKCKRVWYKPWKKRCKEKTMTCYNSHRYKYNCVGLAARERFYYYPDCDRSKEKSVDKWRACFGFTRDNGGCIEHKDFASKNCHYSWGSSLKTSYTYCK